MEKKSGNKGTEWKALPRLHICNLNPHKWYWLYLKWKISYLHYTLALPKLSDYEQPTPNFRGQKHLPRIRLRVPVLLNLDFICECLILSHSPSLTQIVSIPHTVSLLDWHPVHLLNQGLVEFLSYSRYLINTYSMTQINECYMAKPSYVGEGGAVAGKC